jgi:hypothetical protein
MDGTPPKRRRWLSVDKIVAVAVLAMIGSQVAMVLGDRTQNAAVTANTSELKTLANSNAGVLARLTSETANGRDNTDALIRHLVARIELLLRDHEARTRLRFTIEQQDGRIIIRATLAPPSPTPAPSPSPSPTPCRANPQGQCLKSK